MCIVENLGWNNKRVYTFIRDRRVPSTLTFDSFVVSWSTWMHIISFESLDIGAIDFFLAKSVATVCFKRSRSICILCYDSRVLWPAKSTIKSHATPLGFWHLKDINWNFKWTTIPQRPSSNGCKVMGHQSWWSKKILDLLGSRLHFM